MGLHNRVLVTDSGGCRGDLLVIRSLGKRKIGTTLMTQEGLVPSMFSRWRPECVYCPSPTDNLKGFVKALLRNAKTGRYLTLFPINDSSLLPISEHRNQLTPHLKLVLPSHESVLKALDKSQTLKIAEEIGIPTPKTFQARNRAEVINVSTRIQYPAVIKPRRSFVWGQNGKANYSRPFYVNSASELITSYAKVEKNFPSPLIQEYVPGYNIQVALLFDQGTPKAACLIKEQRTIPITGGNSVLRESIPPDPTLLRYASNLLKRLDWHGVAEVEFRIDSRDLPQTHGDKRQALGVDECCDTKRSGFPLSIILAGEKRTNTSRVQVQDWRKIPLVRWRLRKSYFRAERWPKTSQHGTFQ